MTLKEFITSNPDPTKLKRALVVKMRIQGMKHREIPATLVVGRRDINNKELQEFNLLRA